MKLFEILLFTAAPLVPLGASQETAPPATIAQDRKGTSPSEILEQFENLLVASKSRPIIVPYAAIAALRAGNVDKAEAYGREALSYSREVSPWQGAQIYYANEALGWVALKRGDIAGARYYLAESAKSQGSQAIGTFGPNMLLADALLSAGERNSVLEFLEQCRPLWPGGAETIRKWEVLIREGFSPEFGRNLVLVP